jgi:hypothetical protein
MGLVIREPIREDFLLARIVGAQHGKQSGVEIRQRVKILTVDILDPLAILFGVPTVTDANEQGLSFSLALKNTARADEPEDRPLGRVESAIKPNYGFGADDAASAAAPAALAALVAAPAAVDASAAAAEAAPSAAVAAAGAEVSVMGAGASVLLPQALSTSAATKALKAILVFIYRYPRNI